MRVLLDTNVLVSALIKKGKPRILLDSVLAERHKLIISTPKVEELSKVLAERRIRRYVTGEDTASHTFIGRELHDRGHEVRVQPSEYPR